MSLSVHIDNKNKDILILGEGLTQGIDDIALTAEAKYLVNFAQPKTRFLLSLHYNRNSSYLFVNASKIYQFKDSEIKYYTLYLHNISKINNMKKNPD